MLSKMHLEKNLNALLSELEGCFLSSGLNENVSLSVFSTLEHRIKKICDEIVSLPTEEKKFFKPLITNVLQKSEELKDLLIKRRAQIEEQINSLNTSAKAARAYKQYSTK